MNSRGQGLKASWWISGIGEQAFDEYNLIHYTFNKSLEAKRERGR